MVLFGLRCSWGLFVLFGARFDLCVCLFDCFCLFASLFVYGVRVCACLVVRVLVCLFVCLCCLARFGLILFGLAWFGLVWLVSLVVFSPFVRLFA